MSWRYSRSLLFLSAATNICDAEEGRKLAVCFQSEAGSCSRYLEISLRPVFSLSEKERNIIFLPALRFVVTYLCPVRSRRQDYGRKVKDG